MASESHVSTHYVVMKAFQPIAAEHTSLAIGGGYLPLTKGAIVELKWAGCSYIEELGWAWGSLVNASNSGWFPLACVLTPQEFVSELHEYRMSATDEQPVGFQPHWDPIRHWPRSLKLPVDFVVNAFMHQALERRPVVFMEPSVDHNAESVWLAIRFNRMRILMSGECEVWLSNLKAIDAHITLFKDSSRSEVSSITWNMAVRTLEQKLRRLDNLETQMSWDKVEQGRQLCMDILVHNKFHGMLHQILSIVCRILGADKIRDGRRSFHLSLRPAKQGESAWLNYAFADPLPPQPERPPPL